MHLVSLLAAVATWQAAAWQAAAATPCPGAIDIGGHGAIILANAKFDTPGVASRGADVVGRSAVEPHLEGRTYFANGCLDGNYSNTQYAAFQLLGKRLRYMTDISGATCGCNAGLSLLPMRENTDESQCLDYYCDASSLCGVACSEINIQEANRHAWHSTLHSASDARGLSMGFGGDRAESGPRNFNATEYGPGARCVDTSKPFQVAASFPVDVRGALERMEVELSQEGQPCVISMGIMGSSRVMSELSEAVRKGLTPVISYRGSHDLQWLDGQGQDGKGPCAVDTPVECADSVKFYDFVVEPIREGPPPGDGPAASMAAATASDKGQGQERPCIDGWRLHPECIAAFTYEGTIYEGCMSADYQPWCSRDAAYAGMRLLCDPCWAPLAPEPARAEAPNVATSSTPQPTTSSTAAAPECQWAVHFDITVPNTWDSFTLVEQGTWPIAIKTVHGKYLAVEVGGTVRADFDQVPLDGIFTIERDGWMDGVVNILTSSGQYLSAAADGALVARSRRPEDKDRFVMVERDDGTVSIRTADFKYLISEESCVPACASGESSYQPLDMPGQGPGWAMDASGCQALCTSMPSCMHFTFFAAGKTCHVADGGSRLQLGTVGAVAGPAACVRLPVPPISLPARLPSCAKADAYYHPLDSAGLPQKWESDAVHCQWHCAAQPECAYFTFFRLDGSCHLSDGGGELRRSSEGAVAGPAKCGGGAAAAIENVQQAASALMLVGTSTIGTTTTGGFLAKGTATKGPHVGSTTTELAASNDQQLAWTANEETECEWPLRFSSLAPSGWGRFRWMDMGYGAVALQAWHGRYVGIARDGSLRAQFKKLQQDTTIFEVAWDQDGSFSLSTLNGQFVAVAADGPLMSMSLSERAAFRRINDADGTFTLRTSTNGSLIAEKACTPICAKRHASYNPLDMPGRVPTRGGDAASCQTQCAALPGCAHFTFMIADRSCHLAGNSARPSRGRAGAIAGPPRCDEVVIMDEVPAAAPVPSLQQHSWAAAAFVGCVAMPALLALARRASAKQASGTARSISFSELLPQDNGEDDEPPTDNEWGQDRNLG